MRLPIDKPFEPVMKYFTPDLFLRFNSPDQAVADAADEAWEAAVREYRDHLDDLDGRLPDSVKQLAGLCLHDAELLTWEELVPQALNFGFEPVSGLATVSLQQGDGILSLTYFLWEPLRRHDWDGSWPFAQSEVHWLYDEVDLAPDSAARFLHRVLLSDGLVLEIPFVAVMIHRIRLRAEWWHEATR